MSAVLGIDVDSKKLVTCIVVDKKKSNAVWRDFENKESDFPNILEYLKKNKISRVIMEATGGYEQKIFHFLWLKSFDVHVVKPNQGRDFAKAMNILAKNDKIDAFVLGRLGQVADLPTPIKANETQLKIKPLVMRRSQLKEIITQERNRLHIANESTKEDINGHIQFLNERVSELETRVENHIKSDPQLKKMQQVIIKTIGYAEVTAAVILGLLPEIGRLSNKAVAGLAGLAPMDDDSGNRKGKRFIKGGRWHLRKALYMPAYSSIRHDPVINAFHKRLIENGKPKKVATVAVMRKVLVRTNAIVRNYLKAEQEKYEDNARQDEIYFNKNKKSA